MVRTSRRTPALPRAQRIRIHGGHHECVVAFRIRGVDQEEIRPPGFLRPNIARRIAAMGSVPIYHRDETGEGEILRMIEGRPERPRSSVQVFGHGRDPGSTMA
jgi:hypothetical protein